MIKAILICLLAINVVTFFVYGIDKYKAKHSKWRISEATLLLLAVIGGSIGAWCGMKVWHHKTMSMNGESFSSCLPISDIDRFLRKIVSVILFHAPSSTVQTMF